MANQTISAHEFLRLGQLDEALASLKQDVQSDPADAKHRIFLFQLLSVFGKWDSAVKQLEISGDLDPANLAMVQAYREAIRCEQQRQRIFRGEESPLILGEPDEWLALLIESLKQHAAGNGAEAASLRGTAMEAAPTTSGQLTLADESTSDFEWVADADPRMGPVLEALLNGQYYWIPMHRIAQIDFEAPADLRDFVWTPIQLTLATGVQTVAMVPTRYFQSEATNDSAIRLARKTDWQNVPGDDAQFGLGQRMIATDADDFALLDLRRISLNVEMDATDEEATQTAEEGDLVPNMSVGLTAKPPSANESV
ncbi:MAG: type VI secretion system accessory protein TagJ [Planctomycetota bacterium]